MEVETVDVFTAAGFASAVPTATLLFLAGHPYLAAGAIVVLPAGFFVIGFVWEAFWS